jgi:hypothetical protein
MSTHELRSSSFLLPELDRVGDTVCDVLRHGMEEELLGSKILQRVQGHLKQGRVTSGDVVRLALLTDSLSVCVEAIEADGSASESELKYALALAQAAGKRLVAFRDFYADLGETTRETLREFLNAHRKDRQLFGGACADTRWLGLEIVRRVSQETGDREALDRYGELMVRLAEEVLALDSSGSELDTRRQALEQKLQLRKRLAEVQAAAPEQSADPRIRVFCARDATDVFHGVEHAQQVFRRDPFDVDSVHGAARVAFHRLVSRAAEQSEAGSGRVMVVLGGAGSGKTHLIRGFRQSVHGERNGYVGYMQLSVATDDYGRLVLGRLIESLEKPYDEPDTLQSGLLCLSDALLHSCAAISSEALAQLRSEELSDTDAVRLVVELADRVLDDSTFRGVDLDLVRVMLFLQRRTPRIHTRALKFLRCEPMSKPDAAVLGEVASQTDSVAAMRRVAQLGRLIASTGGGALVLLLDQMEEMANLDKPKESFVRLVGVVTHVMDHVPNAVVVITALRDLYKEMSAHLTRSMCDRLERDPEPCNLAIARTEEEVSALLQRRLEHLYETSGVRHRADDPLFPFDKAFVGSLAELSARDVLNEAHRFRERCIEAGTIVGPSDETRLAPPPPPAAPLDSFMREWDAFRATAALEVPEDDRDMLGLLASSLGALGHELAEGVELKLNHTPTELTAALLQRGQTRRKVLIHVTNRSPRGGGLANQLDALLQAAAGGKTTPVAVRSSEFAKATPASLLAKRSAEITKRGGHRIAIEDADWRTMVAFQAFAASHKGNAGFDAWRKRDRPLAALDSLRSVLGLQPGAVLEESVVRASMPTTSTPPRVPSVPNLGAVSLPSQSANTNDPGKLRIGVTLSVLQAPALVAAEQLKKHAAFLGASGSGKTSLALNVIEQLVERGVGAVLVDRKGDIALYADPAWWTQPLADPAQARRRDALREKVHVRMFTPGNPEGRSLGIRAMPDGLADLAAHDRSQLARFASQGLGAMMGYKGRGTEQTRLAILTKAIEVLGMASKRELGLRDVIGLIADQDESLIAELGHLEPTFMRGLVNDLETLRVNHSTLLESKDEPLRANLLMGRDGSIPAGKVPITIVSTKFLGDAQRVDFWLSQMLVALSRWCSRNPSALLQSVLFLDEADAYLPATSKPATKDPLLDLLKRARSAGLGVMLATQNPGDLDYKARDNIGTWWIGRVSSSRAVEKMKPLLSECRTDVSGSLATAGTGEFYQVSDGQVARIRSDRSMMDTTQLSEDRILELAAQETAFERRAG